MKKSFIPDLLSGLTVSFAALSLGAAFGVMSGRGAFAGMLGAAVIPIVTSIFGGTRLQASGPTAPMTAITALIVAKAYDSFPGDKIFQEQYITFALLLASLFIILSGVFRLGKFIRLVPQVVILGFMNGIGVLIWADQLKKLMGLGGITAMEGDTSINLLIAFGSLGLIYLIPMLLKKLNVPSHIKRFVPSIFVTIVSVTFITQVLQAEVQHVQLGTSFNSFSEFVNTLVLYFPSNLKIFTPEILKSVVLLSAQLCLLAYLDSLLTSLVVDKMTKEKTYQNKELFAQGLANGIVGLLQGIPGAQATIRSVLLLKEGAQTRMAGVFVGIFTLLGFLVFGKWISLISSAVFAGILFKAGLDVLDRDFTYAFLKYRWINNRLRVVQLIFIAYTTLVTVLLDLNIAVISGTILFYLAKRFLGMVDAEDDFSVVHANNLHGQDLSK